VNCKWLAYDPAANVTPSSLASLNFRMGYHLDAGLLRLSWKRGRLSLSFVDHWPYQAVSFRHQKPRVRYWDDGRLQRLLGHIECLGWRCWCGVYLWGTFLHRRPAGDGSSLVHTLSQWFSATCNLWDYTAAAACILPYVLHAMCLLPASGVCSIVRSLRCCSGWPCQWSFCSFRFFSLPSATMSRWLH